MILGRDTARPPGKKPMRTGYSLNTDFPERDPNARIQDCGNKTVGGCERVNFLFAFQLISFVSWPDNGQIAFKNRVRAKGQDWREGEIRL
jgi:hypothetical protein